MCTYAYVMSEAVVRRKAVEELVDVFDSAFFKALSEPVRVEILKVLLLRGRCDIATVATHVSKDRSVLSRHLHLLTGAGLLRAERVSRNTFFEIDAEGFLGKADAILGRVVRAVSKCCVRRK